MCAGEMAQRVKMLAPGSDGLSSISRTHMSEEKNLLLEIVL